MGEFYQQTQTADKWHMSYPWTHNSGHVQWLFNRQNLGINKFKPYPSGSPSYIPQSRYRFFWSTFGVRFNAESDELSGSIDAPCFNPCPFGWLKKRGYLSDIKINSDTIHRDVLNISSIHFWDPKVTMWQGLSYPETSGTIRFGTRCNC